MTKRRWIGLALLFAWAAWSAISVLGKTGHVATALYVAFAIVIGGALVSES